MKVQFRRATSKDEDRIWVILQQAIARRKIDGSLQWQQGYPNPTVVAKDVEDQHGFVLCDRGVVQAYAAIILNDEPAYQKIDGKWLTSEDFYVIHRVAVADEAVGKGFAKQLFDEAEAMAKAHHIRSLRVDTNFDNPAMLHIFKVKGFAYCGEVMLKGALRKAYEKVCR